MVVVVCEIGGTSMFTDAATLWDLDTDDGAKTEAETEAWILSGMWKWLTASNLEDGIAISIVTTKWKRKRKWRWRKRHENLLRI